MGLSSPQQRDELLKLFDQAESEVIARALIEISKLAPGDAELLSGQMKQLSELSHQVWAAPSLGKRQVLGGESRDQRTLREHLKGIDGLTGDLDLPLKAVLQRTFLTAKIQFLRAFVKSTTVLCETSPTLAPLNVELREELAQSIYTLMAEELFLALLRKPGIQPLTKQRAGQQLIAIWDNATLEIDDFCPLLESAWHARNRITPGLGSLLGATEYFRLVAEDCSPQFLDFFARDEVSDSENAAFAEFLFGLTFEELETLRVEMKKAGREIADEAWASVVLGRTIEHDCEGSQRIEPVALYRSYMRRQLAADFRNLAGSPGPKRTAETYLMVYLLDQQAL